MHRRRIWACRRFISLATFAFLVTFFLPGGLLAQKVETVDGVRVVHNSGGGKWGKIPEISLELVRTLGKLEAEDENLAFYLPEDIAVDAAGNMYILDSGNHRIQKFSADGRYLATFGRKGQGPAEFYFPSSLDIDAKGYLYISDPNNQRIQVLTPEGKDHRVIRMIEGEIGEIACLKSGDLAMGGGEALMRMGMEEEKPKELPKLVKILDREGKVMRELGTQHDFENILLNRAGNRIYYAIDPNDHVYLAFPHQNRIEKYSVEGKLLWRADRELNYSMEPPKEKGKIERRGGGVMIQSPQMKTCCNGIAVDEKGRVWVAALNRQIKDEEKVETQVSMTNIGGQRSMSYKFSGATELQKTDMYKLEVYDADGVLLGEIPLDHFVDGIFIYGDRLFLLDKMRGTKFYEYRISK